MQQLLAGCVNAVLQKRHRVGSRTNYHADTCRREKRSGRRGIVSKIIAFTLESAPTDFKFSDKFSIISSDKALSLSGAFKVNRQTLSIFSTNISLDIEFSLPFVITDTMLI